MNILGSVSEIGEDSMDLSAYSVYELNGVVFRTLTTSISHTYMYDLLVYDSDKIDEVIFENSYDSNNYIVLSLCDMRKIISKVPKLRPIFRNLVLDEIIGR